MSYQPARGGIGVESWAHLQYRAKLGLAQAGNWSRHEGSDGEFKLNLGPQQIEGQSAHVRRLQPWVRVDIVARQRKAEGAVLFADEAGGDTTLPP